MLTKPCPVCGERTANALTSLVWPRCKVCRAKFRVRFGFGIGFAASYVPMLVLLGSLAIAAIRRDDAVFTLGFVAFVVLKLVLFCGGRLEADRRDPVTAMQLRLYARGKRAAREHESR